MHIVLFAKQFMQTIIFMYYFKLYIHIYTIKMILSRISRRVTEYRNKYSRWEKISWLTKKKKKRLTTTLDTFKNTLWSWHRGPPRKTCNGPSVFFLIAEVYSSRSSNWLIFDLLTLLWKWRSSFKKKKKGYGQMFGLRTNDQSVKSIN